MVKGNNMRHIKFLLLIMTVIILATGVVYAGISVTPDRHIVSLLPGEEKTVMYHIHNTGDEDIDIIIEPKAWAGLRDPYKWLSLESDDIYARAGERSPLIVNVFAPEDAEGEMVAMLFLCYKESIESQLNIRQGTPLYMVIKGTENYDLDIEDVSISYARKGHFYDLNFAVKIKNTGNVHIVPDVKVVIRNSKGRVLRTLSLVRPNIVLREKNQTYRLGWREPGLREDTYTAEIILDYEDKIKSRSKEIVFKFFDDNVEKIGPVETGD